MAEKDIPPDNGALPRIDRDGSVHGSGVGAGGGSEGEDFDDDPATGDGYSPADGGRRRSEDAPQD